jgi:FKBP-type peptidyl-prolyl cis-trans isomerase FkpA
MKQFIYILIFALLAFISSCTDSKSYSTTDNGLEYRYCVESNSGKSPKTGEKLLLRVQFYNEHDTLLWDSREISERFIMEFEKPTKPGATVNDAYAMMQEGDSMSFKINAIDFYSAADKNSPMLKKFRKDEKLRFQIKLEKIYSPEAFKDESEKIVKSLAQEEKNLLEDYIEKNYPDLKPTKSGMYFKNEIIGKGEQVKANSEIALHYKATYINGEILHSTYVKNNPLIFKVNDPLVWPCLAEAVQLMRKGGKAICIAPSNIAAGLYGDKKLKIGPCKTIIFELQVVAIR